MSEVKPINDLAIGSVSSAMRNIAASYCYNTDVVLWENYGKANPTRILTLVDGHVGHTTDGWLARFRDDAEATEVLKQAGWVPVGIAGFEFKPQPKAP